MRVVGQLRCDVVDERVGRIRTGVDALLHPRSSCAAWEVQLCCGSVGLVCVSTLAELVAVGLAVTPGVGG
ncbi:hypothetical protein, partial [Mycobacterium marinum]